MTDQKCATDGCDRFTESPNCPLCANCCDFGTRSWCRAHWEFPGRCQTDTEWCHHQAPHDCIMCECNKHCTSPNCERHRNPPDRHPSNNRTPGLRSLLRAEERKGKGKGKGKDKSKGKGKHKGGR